MLNDKSNSGLLDINCCDPLGRSALLMGIDNENLEMVELLLDHKVGYEFQNIYHTPRLRETCPFVSSRNLLSNCCATL